MIAKLEPSQMRSNGSCVHGGGGFRGWKKLVLSIVPGDDSTVDRLGDRLKGWFESNRPWFMRMLVLMLLLLLLLLLVLTVLLAFMLVLVLSISRRRPRRPRRWVHGEKAERKKKRETRTAEACFVGDVPTVR
jgi:hypothetical protein